MNFEQQEDIQKQQCESVIEKTCIIFSNRKIMKIHWLIITVFGHKTFGIKSYGAVFQDIHNVATQIDHSTCLTPGFANDGNINIENDMNTGIPSDSTNTPTAPIKRSAEACLTNLLIVIFFLAYYFDYTITIKFYFLQAKRRKINKKTIQTQQKRKKTNDNKADIIRKTSMECLC